MIFQKVTETSTVPNRFRDGVLRISKLGFATELKITNFQFRTNLEDAKCISRFDITIFADSCTFKNYCENRF